LKSIVEHMGGEIGVKSKEGEGSLFYFTLPLKKGSYQDVGKEHGHLWLESLDLPALDVLVVEDNEVNRELARVMLGRMGLHVSEAENGIEALITLSERGFDVVFMDVQMPGMDGITATRIIRALEDGGDADLAALDPVKAERLRQRLYGKHTKIVSMTAHALSGDRYKCLEAGMDAYISKPFSPEDVVRVLEELGIVDAKSRLSQGETLEEMDAYSTQVEKGSSASIQEIKDYLEDVYGMEEEELSAFLKTSAEVISFNLRRLEEALQNGDLATVAEVAHTLKGGLASLGMKGASTLALSLEKAAKGEEADFPFEETLQELAKSCSILTGLMEE